MGLIAARRGLWQFARESFEACGIETLARYQLENAMRAFLITGDPKAADVARAGLALLARGGLEASARDLLRVAEHCAALGLDKEMEGYLRHAEARGDRSIVIRAENLRRERARIRAAGVAIGCERDDYATIFAAALRAPLPGQLDRIQVGILDYRNPTCPSTNIGDHVQTVAALGQLAAFDFADLQAPAGVASLLAARPGERVPVAGACRIVVVDRDFSVAQVDEGRIWLPVCGWFQHETHPGRYGFPFPGNILPIYMSLHIAKPEILDEAAIAHLERFAPIGCRDLNTVRLLRNVGIPAFFNGCVTLTLDRLFPPHDAAREGAYVADYHDHGQTPAGYELVPHASEEVILRDFGDNLALAASMLARYRRAVAVRTPLLHCYLPCRAMRTPVEFTNGNLSNAQFEGLVGIPDAEVARIADRFEAKYRAVMTAVLSSAEPDAVYALWREQSALDMARTDTILVARREELRALLPAGRLDPAWLAAVPRRDLGTGEPGTGERIDVIFCFDARLADAFAPTLRSATSRSSKPLRVHIIGRDLPEDFLRSLPGGFPQVELLHYDVSGLEFGAVDLLAHTSISTMDRLIAPEIVRDVARAIYLDVDLLVRGDLAELAATDLEGAEIAGRDSLDPDWRNGFALLATTAIRMEPERASAFRDHFLSAGTVRFDAFNAGVMVMDLERLRASGFSARTFEVVSRFGVNDQFALNIYARQARKKLPPAWNHFASQENLTDPKIVHFVGPQKPWHSGRYHPWFDEWRAYRDATPDS